MLFNFMPKARRVKVKKKLTIVLMWPKPKYFHFRKMEQLYHTELHKNSQMAICKCFGVVVFSKTIMHDLRLLRLQSLTTTDFLNIQTPKKFVVITLKFELCCSTIELWSIRCRPNGKQCRPWSDCFGAVWSGSALFSPDLSVLKLRLIMVWCLYVHNLLSQSLLSFWICSAITDSLIYDFETFSDTQVAILVTHLTD